MASPTLEEIINPNWRPETDDDRRSLDYYARQVFRPGAPIDEDNLFVGRQTQARKLLDVIYQPGVHAILYGERGVGKTSLVTIIKDRVFDPVKYTKVLKYGCNPTDSFGSIWSNIFFGYDWKRSTNIRMGSREPTALHNL